MDRNTVLWSLVAFFGGSVAFRGIQDATKGEPVALTFALQAVALALIVGLIVFVVRRQR